MVFYVMVIIIIIMVYTMSYFTPSLKSEARPSRISLDFGPAEVMLVLLSAAPQDQSVHYVLLAS